MLLCKFVFYYFPISRIVFETATLTCNFTTMGRCKKIHRGTHCHFTKTLKRLFSSFCSCRRSNVNSVRFVRVYWTWISNFTFCSYFCYKSGILIRHIKKFPTLIHLLWKILHQVALKSNTYIAPRFFIFYVLLDKTDYVLQMAYMARN